MLMHACKSNDGSNNTNRKSDWTQYNAVQAVTREKVTEHIGHTYRASISTPKIFVF